jgi:hypothetical protein
VNGSRAAVNFDLTGVATDTPLRLYFDLIGFVQAASVSGGAITTQVLNASNATTSITARPYGTFFSSTDTGFGGSGALALPLRSAAAAWYSLDR